MAGRIDQVQDVRDSIVSGEGQAHGLAFDGDAPLTLDVHAVEVLGTHLSRVNHPGELQHPISQRRLAMVDVGNDAEIADQRGIGGARLGCGRSGHVSQEILTRACETRLSSHERGRTPNQTSGADPILRDSSCTA